MGILQQGARQVLNFSVYSCYIFVLEELAFFCCCVGEFILLQHANVDPHLDRVGKESLPFSIVSCKIYVTLLKVQQSFCSPLSAHDLIQLCISGGFLSVINISKLKNHPKKTSTNWPQPFFGSVSLGHQGTYQLSSFLSFLLHKVYSTASGTCWLLDQDATLHMKIAMWFPETKGDKDIWNHMEKYEIRSMKT